MSESEREREREIKIIVSFAKETYKRDNILQKRPMNLSIGTGTGTVR